MNFKVPKYVYILFCLIIPLYCLTLNNFFQEDITLWDGCNYMMLAKSLSEGRGYQIMGSPHTIAPFMFPLLLSPIVKCFGYNIFLMRLLEVLFAILTIISVFILFGEIRSQTVGIIVALWTGLSPLLFYQSTEILSEIPYLFFSIVTLFFLHKTVNEDKLCSTSLGLSILFMSISYYTRTIGLSFLFALFLFLGFEIWFSSKRVLVLKKVILLSSGFVMLIIPWLLRNRNLAGNFLGAYGTTYGITKSFLDSINLIKTNLTHYQTFVPQIFSLNLYNKGTIIIILILITTGFLLVFLSRRRTIVECYFIVSLLVLLIYPFRGGNKYLLTYLPFFFYYIFLSLEFFANLCEKILNVKRIGGIFCYGSRTFLFIPAILSLLPMMFSNIGIVKKERKADYYSPIMLNLQQVCEYIRTNTPDDAVFLVSRIHPYISLLTGRKVDLYTEANIDPSRAADTERIINRIEQVHASYVITDGSFLSVKSFEPVIKVNEGHFEKVFASGTSSLYRVIRPIDTSKLVYLKGGEYPIKIRPVRNPSADKVGPWDEIKPGGELDAAILVEPLHPDQIEKVLIGSESKLGQTLQVYPFHKGIWSCVVEAEQRGSIIYFEPYEMLADLRVEIHYGIIGMKDVFIYKGTIKKQDVLLTLKKNGREPVNGERLPSGVDFKDKRQFDKDSGNRHAKRVSTGKPMPDSGFRAELTIKQIPTELKMGEEGSAAIRVKNISDQTWPSRGDSRDNYRVNLGYQLFSEKGTEVVTGANRIYLPKDLRPGESVELLAVLKAPDRPGTYTIRFDMVQEAVAWFGHKNKDNYSKSLIILVSPR